MPAARSSPAAQLREVDGLTSMIALQHLFLVALLALSASACRNESTVVSLVATAAPTAMAEPTAAAAPTAATSGGASGNLKIGMVTDIAKLGDKSFNDSAWKGVQDAAKALGVARQTVLHKVQRGELRAIQVTNGRRKGLRIEIPDIGLDRLLNE